MRRIQEIDGLRALAVLAVLYNHMIPGWAQQSVKIEFGWMGVDLFFAISGFLITRILLALKTEKSGYFRTFYSRRALRILPPYYLVLCFYLIVEWASSSPFAPRAWVIYFLYLGSYLSYNTVMNYIHQPIAVVLGLGVLWSLSIEENFYLIWAPVVRFAKNRSLIVILAGVMLAAPVVRGFVHQPEGFPEYFWFPARIDALAYGAMAAMLSEKVSVFRSKVALAILAPAYIVFVASTHLADRNTLAFATVGYSLLDAACAALVLFAFRHSGSAALVFRLLRQRWVQRIARTSYCIYLIHEPIYSCVSRAIRVTGIHGPLYALVVLSISLTLTLGLAELSWRYFEGPILALKDRFFPAKPRLSTATAVG